MLATQAQSPLDLKPVLHDWELGHRCAKLGADCRSASNQRHDQLIKSSADLLRNGGKLRLVTGVYDLVARAQSSAFVVDIIDSQGQSFSLTYKSPEDAVMFLVGSYDGSAP
jgi:hypothetical protein